MEILLELNMKQKLATRLGIVLSGLVIYALLCYDSPRLSIALFMLLTMLIRNPTMIYALVMTAERDAIALYRFVGLNVYLLRMEHRNWTVARVFQEQARRQPHKPCFIMDDHMLTYAQVEELSNKIAAYFRAEQVQRGDCVGLLMDTRVEYPCMWLGLSKLGITTALINSHLRRDTLLHSIKVANVRALIVGSELIDVLEELQAAPELQQLPIYQYTDEDQQAAHSFKLMPGAVDLRTALLTEPLVDLSTELARSNTRDKLIYVYTSGTTGLPKAAVITNLRYMFMCAGSFYMLQLRPEDIIYNPLPLYHTAGGIVGIGNMLNGSTIVLRKKFSASNFWRDCLHHKCTVAQYIGELCRYLLATEYTTEQRQHQLRLMYGNGLRPQIWTQFVSRFGIPHIGEVYGATEGNSNLINITNRVGAIGFVPVFGRRFFPVQVIRCDQQTGEPLRNSNGLCTRCEPGEAGLLIGQVDARRAVTAFLGYADRSASEQKLLRNVYKKGDVYFNSGDMIVSDLLGYFYFKDRTGDTFRWRGENVATQEVEAIITNCIGLNDCVVYGVEIPHVEGKAGMAAIASRKVDMSYLSIGIRGSLPAYARPLFIRLLDEIPRTATFKLKKRELAVEGFDLTHVQDPIYYLNRDGIYRQLTQEQFEALQAGTAGL